MQLAFVECRDQQIASNSGFGKIGFLDKFSEILRIAKFKFVCGWEFCECQPQTKHVERLLFHFSDVGSTPTASTKKTRLGLFLWRGSCCAPAQANFVCNPLDVAGARRCLLVSGVNKLTANPVGFRTHIKKSMQRWRNGIRAGFRYQWPQGCVGSNPILCTKNFSQVGILCFAQQCFALQPTL